MTTRIRTYRELSLLSTFLERFHYLQMHGQVGDITFGFDRYLNQTLYQTRRWKRTRDLVIIRDNGCDLGLVGYEMHGVILVHHMNPLRLEDIEHERDEIFDPEYLISTCLRTHQAIHYGDESLLPQLPIQRRPGDTCPWR